MLQLLGHPGCWRRGWVLGAAPPRAPAASPLPARRGERPASPPDATEQQALPINLGRASCCNEDGEVYPRFPRRISEIANRFSWSRRWAFPTPRALAARTTSAAPGLRAPEEEPGRSIRLSWYATSPAGSVIRAITAAHRRAVHHSPFVAAAGHQQDASRGTALPRGWGPTLSPSWPPPLARSVPAMLCVGWVGNAPPV